MNFGINLFVFFIFANHRQSNAMSMVNVPIRRRQERDITIWNIKTADMTHMFSGAYTGSVFRVYSKIQT